MHTGRFVFSQLMDFLPKNEFNKCVLRYHGNHRIRTFSCYDQFLCMAFGQLTYRQSLRDVITIRNILAPVTSQNNQCLSTIAPELRHSSRTQPRGVLARR